MICIIACGVLIIIGLVFIYWPPAIKWLDNAWNNRLVDHAVTGVRRGKLKMQDVHDKLSHNLHQGELDRRFAEPSSETPAQRAERLRLKDEAREELLTALLQRVAEKLKENPR